MRLHPVFLVCLLSFVMACGSDSDIPTPDGGSADMGVVDALGEDTPEDAVMGDNAVVDSGDPDAFGSCSRADIEERMTATLGGLTTDEDFALRLLRADGVQYDATRGVVTPETRFESASTSKIVTAAIVLWVTDSVDGFGLSSRPQEYVTGWDPAPDSGLAEITLLQLLSFTSGLVVDPFCVSLGAGRATFNDCIQRIFEQNQDAVPGAAYNYGPSHLQVAGAMAIGAGGYADWQALFSAFTTSTGLFPTATYDLPRPENPRLAGGMHWTGEEFVLFLDALAKNEFLGAEVWESMFSDQVGDTPIDESPAFDALGYHWRYGLGQWLECPEGGAACKGAEFYSSPGAYGAYPFVNRTDEYVGFVSRQGGLRTYKNGYDVFDSVRAVSQEWARCDSP